MEMASTFMEPSTLSMPLTTLPIERVTCARRVVGVGARRRLAAAHAACVRLTRRGRRAEEGRGAARRLVARAPAAS